MPYLIKSTQGYFGGIEESEYARTIHWITNFACASFFTSKAEALEVIERIGDTWTPKVYEIQLELTR